jgi:hypothetical protein
MTRYFYTDPLAAAWMAKHFGMEFHDEAGDAITIEVLLDDAIHGEQVRNHVHPDSLPLLQPQAGDVVRFGDDRGHAEPRLVVEADFSGSPDDDNIAVLSSFEPSWWNWNVVVQKSIIQRDGKAFMWPESEDANGLG